jgi:proteasome lid subunit RPN8/RPN11
MLSEIKAECESCYPNECCGILFGDMENDSGIKYARMIQSITNSFEDGERYHRFLITAESMMRAEQYARRNRLDIVGFYHSHPDCEAVASEYDRAHALPVYSYIIVSVRDGRAVDIRSWELDVSENGTVFNSERLEVKENV